MYHRFLSLALFALAHQHTAFGAPTWPSPTDELEDLIFLVTGYRHAGFATQVLPCGFSPSGPGRITAAEWIRTAFHDMATANNFTGIGGLDASIAFEVNSGENQGAGFATSLSQFAPFLSPRSSMADIISVGVYTATRACGGPIIPIRAGRRDATAGGPIGVPLPQNSLGTFRNQFLRMGFDSTEMISFVACGHSLGGVHSQNFPLIVPANTAPNDFAKFHTSNGFDNTLAKQYIDGTTKDPLVVGPAVARNQNSDFQVFNSDGNATLRSMTDAATFSSVCRTMFQKMIEVVPPGTTLTDPIVPYDIKPYDVQLTLLDGGERLSFSGEIRVTTTTRPITQIAAVQLVYKDRTGASASTPIETTSKGTADGFDNTFSFYAFSSTLSSETSISSFNVVINLVGGSTELHDNNGASFPVSDTILYQPPQSCLDPSSNTLTIVAAVRNPSTASPTLNLVLKIPRPSPNPVPSLSPTSVPMPSASTTIGPYTLHTATYTFTSPSLSQSALFDISAGISSPPYPYHPISSLSSACTPLSPSGPNTTDPTPRFSYQGCYTDNTPSRSLTGSTHYSPSGMTLQFCSSACQSFALFGLEYGAECYCGNTRASSSSQAAAIDCNMPCSGNSSQTCGAGNRLSLYRNLEYAPMTHPNVSGYTYQGCFNEPDGRRALAGLNMASDGMTVEACRGFCAGAPYFGVEYGRECYCGLVLAEGSVVQPVEDCGFACAGNANEYCGAGNRLDVYKSDSAASPQNPVVPGYVYKGCYVDSVGDRILAGAFLFDSGMTVERCRGFCGSGSGSGNGTGSLFFGVEYGGECYCGEGLGREVLVGQEECGTVCGGDTGEWCGGASRVGVWGKV